MSVGVLDEGLLGTVGSDPAGKSGRLVGVEVFFPFIQIIDDERQMRSAMA